MGASRCVALLLQTIPRQAARRHSCNDGVAVHHCRGVRAARRLLWHFSSLIVSIVWRWRFKTVTQRDTICYAGDQVLNSLGPEYPFGSTCNVASRLTGATGRSMRRTNHQAYRGVSVWQDLFS